jgi:hypothetical protein
MICIVVDHRILLIGTDFLWSDQSAQHTLLAGDFHTRLRRVFEMHAASLDSDMHLC